MDRRAYIESIGTVAITGVLAGCADDGSNNSDGSDTNDSGTNDDNGAADGDSDEEYGTLSTVITDQPNDIDHFESLVVTLQGIWIKPAEGDDETEESEDAEGNETEETEEPENETADEENIDNAEDVDESSGRNYIEFEEPQEADLVELQGGNTQLIDGTEIEVGEYQFLQLDVSDTEGILAETGEEATVDTPGNAPLQFQQSFEIRANEYTIFIADFAPFQRGQGEYLIRPVASGTQVIYGDEEADTGMNDEDIDRDQLPENETRNDSDRDWGEIPENGS